MILTKNDVLDILVTIYARHPRDQKGATPKALYTTNAPLALPYQQVGG